MSSPLLSRLAVALVLAVIVGGSVYAFSQRHVYRVSIRRGEVAYVDIDVPMQRFGRSRNFAKALGLPVGCVVSRLTGDDPGVRISVVETGHSVYRLRARLRVEVARSAAPGSHRRSIDFTIDGQGDWPTAVVVVKVASAGG